MAMSAFAPGLFPVSTLPVLTYQDAQVETFNTNTTVNCGTAFADRYLMFLFRVQLQNTSQVLTSFQVNGATQTSILNYQVDASLLYKIYVVYVPSGTTCTTRHNTTSSSSAIVICYSLSGLTNFTPFASAFIGANKTDTTTMNIPANGFGVGLRYNGGGAGAGTTATTWTGLTRDFTNFTNSTTYEMSSASLVSAAAIGSLSISSFNNNTNGDYMLIASFGNG